MGWCFLRISNLQNCQVSELPDGPLFSPWTVKTGWIGVELANYKVVTADNAAAGFVLHFIPRNLLTRSAFFNVLLSYCQELFLFVIYELLDSP